MTDTKREAPEVIWANWKWTDPDGGEWWAVEGMGGEMKYRLASAVQRVGCGYCGETLYEYPAGEPGPPQHEAALAAFREHDAKCGKNPLVAKLYAERAKVEELREMLFCEREAAEQLQAKVERIRGEALKAFTAIVDRVCRGNIERAAMGDRIKEELAAIRAAKPNAARAEALEEACSAVCDRCRVGVPVIRWADCIGHKTETGAVPCQAAAIRAAKEK